MLICLNRNSPAQQQQRWSLFVIDVVCARCCYYCWFY